jgi:nicotinamide riboside kinase
MARVETTAVKIALLGAESTGKTVLAHELAAHWRGQGRSVAVVTEVLREWCAREARTPRPEEQLPIAQEQERRVEAAAASAQVVIADTTSLMIAIYSAMIFEDGSLYQFALERQRRYHHTLVTGLDLPWVADGLQRVGAHVREPVDALVRTMLARAGVDYRVVYGSGEQRLRNALAALGSAQAPSAEPAPNMPSSQQQPWVWHCEKCSDPQCEHRLFTSMLARRG